MHWKIILLITFILYPILSNAQGQSDYLIQGQVFSDSMPLVGVNVFVEQQPERGTTTDGAGRFSLTVDSLPIVIQFSYLGFRRERRRIDSLPAELKIQLLPQQFQLSEIIVSAERKIDTVYHSPESVVDYAFKDSFMVLLVFKNNIEKYELIVIDENERVVDRMSLREYKPVRLLQSCEDKVFLITQTICYELEVQPERLSFAQELEYNYVKEQIEPCQLAVPDYFFFENYFYQGQAQQYSMRSRKDTSERRWLPRIEDENNLYLLIEELGVALPRSGDAWGRDASEDLAELRIAPYDLKGAWRMFYPKIYVPIFQDNGQICVFNHIEDEIQYFNLKGEWMRSVPIDYHHFRRWKKQVFQDAIRGTFYTLFDTRWGYHLCEINPKDGSLGPAIPLDRDYVDHVSIHDGMLYFLHRHAYQGARNRLLQRVAID